MQMIPAHFAEPLSQLIFRRVRDGAWLYWPPGPMFQQVFDIERCKADVEQMVKTILDEKQNVGRDLAKEILNWLETDTPEFSILTKAHGHITLKKEKK